MGAVIVSPPGVTSARNVGQIGQSHLLRALPASHKLNNLDFVFFAHDDFILPFTVKFFLLSDLVQRLLELGPEVGLEVRPLGCSVSACGEITREIQRL